MVGVNVAGEVRTQDAAIAHFLGKVQDVNAGLTIVRRLDMRIRPVTPIQVNASAIHTLRAPVVKNVRLTNTMVLTVKRSATAMTKVAVTRVENVCVTLTTNVAIGQE